MRRWTMTAATLAAMVSGATQAQTREGHGHGHGMGQQGACLRGETPATGEAQEVDGIVVGSSVSGAHGICDGILSVTVRTTEGDRVVLVGPERFFGTDEQEAFREGQRLTLHAVERQQGEGAPVLVAERMVLPSSRVISLRDDQGRPIWARSGRYLDGNVEERQMGAAGERQDDEDALRRAREEQRRDWEEERRARERGESERVPRGGLRLGQGDEQAGVGAFGEQQLGAAGEQRIEEGQQQLGAAGQQQLGAAEQRVEDGQQQLGAAGEQRIEDGQQQLGAAEQRVEEGQRDAQQEIGSAGRHAVGQQQLGAAEQRMEEGQQQLGAAAERRSGVFLFPSDMEVGASGEREGLEQRLASDEALSGSPAQMVGRTVIVRGQVSEHLGEQAFVVTYDGEAGTEELLAVGSVVNRPAPGQPVQLRGVVHHFDDRQLRSLDAGGHDLTRFEGQPLVIVETVY